MKKRNNKKSQVTIFIIAGMLMIAIVLLFFFLKSRSDEPGSQTASPGAILETCLKQDVYDAVDTISMQGGYTEIPDLNISYKFGSEPPREIAYLCYTPDDRKPCVYHAAPLFNHVESEIKNYINDSVKECISALGKKYSQEGYTTEVKYENGDFDVRINENEIKIKINAEITLTKPDKSLRYDNLNTVFKTKIYDLINVAQRIIGDNVVDCNFDIANYLSIYPKYNIDKNIALSDYSSIYTIKKQDSPEIFRFAIRGCVYPPGP